MVYMCTIYVIKYKVLDWGNIINKKFSNAGICKNLKIQQSSVLQESVRFPNEPKNRESLWNAMNTDSEMYRWTAQVIRARKSE